MIDNRTGKEIRIDQTEEFCCPQPMEISSAGRAGSKGDDGIEGKGLLPCPFCGEDDFDLIGLKSHFDHGDCAIYNETIDLPRQKF